jgi:uncharacterized protein YjiK
MQLRHLIVAVATAAAALGAQAAGNSIHLGRYQVSGVHGLDIDAPNGVSGLEASAVTYARDRGTLFFVGDEGTGVIEISLTGQTLGSMAFNWSGTGSNNHDTEGLAYLGGGVLAVGEERLQDIYRFSYVSGGTVALGSTPSVSISNAVVGNNGMEGFSYDPRNGGSFVTVKQQSPQDIQAGTLTFAAGLAGTSTMANLFNPSLMGLASLSDVQTLASVDALVGTSAADNLLVLSLASRELVEVTRTGEVLSRLDLSNILAHNGIEGVTVDEKGTIYLVAEQIQDGSNFPGDLNPKSQLIVLTAPVPEPETWAMLLAGLAGVAAFARRQRNPARG